MLQINFPGKLSVFESAIKGVPQVTSPKDETFGVLLYDERGLEVKIGIQTLPLHYNYGGILQAYALQRYLSRLGHEVWLINNRSEHRQEFTFSEVAKSIAKLIIHRKISTCRSRFEFAMACRNTSEFVRKYMNPMTIPIECKTAYRWLDIYNFDAIVVGSDQVWSKKFGGSSYYFLDFLESPRIKKIAYAASFGEETWKFNRRRTQLMSELCQKFNAVSVREKSGVRLCKENLGVDAIHVLDPTMLLAAGDYIDLYLKDDTLASEGSVMAYMLDETKFCFAERVAHTLGLTAFHVRAKTENPQANLEDRIWPRVTQWIRGFDEAKFVITDSFHGCVFSIIFNKPVVVVEHKIAGNERLYSLLHMLGLKNRMIHSIEELTESLINSEIDFNKVNSIIQAKKKESELFLRNALNV